MSVIPTICADDNNLLQEWPHYRGKQLSLKLKSASMIIDICVFLLWGTLSLYGGRGKRSINFV